MSSTSRSFNEGGEQDITISEIIAALSLAVNVVRAVFDIAWKITMERKNAKKD